MNKTLLLSLSLSLSGALCWLRGEGALFLLLLLCSPLPYRKIKDGGHRRRETRRAADARKVSAPPPCRLPGSVCGCGCSLVLSSCRFLNDAEKARGSHTLSVSLPSAALHNNRSVRAAGRTTALSGGGICALAGGNMSRLSLCASLCSPPHFSAPSVSLRHPVSQGNAALSLSLSPPILQLLSFSSCCWFLFNILCSRPLSVCLSDSRWVMGLH
ncbi:hypothetical protein QQF64_023403 [Cirrhinus molitorella]|uniref:Secreted protein n=1 Tax=Cirrhinus molitorella TaxID=172907 RepID=A0ABR3L594_9TELE